MSVELKLEAKGAAEQRCLEYLQANASEALAEKINAGSKTLGGAMAYATGEAKKLAGGAGSVCVDDETVFGWVVHYFEDVKEKATPNVQRPTSNAEVKKEKKAPAPVKEMTEFEKMFGGGK